MFDGPSHWLTKQRRAYYKQYTKVFVFDEVTAYSKPYHDFDWSFCRCRGCKGVHGRNSAKKTHHQNFEKQIKYLDWSKNRNEVWPWK